MSYIPGTITPVPSINSAANVYVSDVIGNKSDDESGTSLASKNYKLETHIHSACKAYPTLANDISVVTAAGAWALGSYTEIVPINTITDPFDIHYIHIGTASVSDTYCIVLYAGTTEIGRCRTTRATGDQSVPDSPFMTPIIPANSQIQAKIACAGGGSRTLTMSIYYHIY